MPKVEPSLKNLSLQPLRSLVSNQPVDPPQWVEEFEKQSYSSQEIISVIEFYEFIISCLVKIFSYFLKIDEDLKESVNAIYSKQLHTFMEKYFHGKVIDYEDFLFWIFQ
jgi:hypothetical protein